MVWTAKRRWGAALLMAMGVAGCGPVTSTITIADAMVAIEGARTAGAEELAQYEFTRARLNLRKAREEEGFSDFQAAIDLATASKTFADKAKARAIQRAEDLAKQPQPTPTGAPNDAHMPTGSSL